MLAQTHSFVLQGIDAVACEVEVDVVADAMPKTTIVGGWPGQEAWGCPGTDRLDCIDSYSPGSSQAQTPATQHLRV